MRALYQVHSRLLTHPFASSFAFSKLIAFAALSPRGNLYYAKRVLSQISDPNIFSWNSLIRGFLNAPNPSPEPLFLFRKLLKRGHPKPNTFTLAFVLKACSVLLSFREGQQVHKHVIQTGFGSSPFVQTSLVNFYGKCEAVVLAQKMFDEIPEKNVVAWSTMISGYSRIGMVNEALTLFREMQEEGIEPDEVTLVSVISACAMSGALDVGRWIHAYIGRHSIKIGLETSTALVNMYAKCGCIEKAQEVFETMPLKDSKAWSSMIVGFAIHGLVKDALETFSKMTESNVEPNHVTYLGVLLACAHGGLVSEGRKHWSRMLESAVESSMEHYGCMVDLYCRANLIGEAFRFVESMTISPNPVIWRMLLVACRRNKVVDKGEIVAKQLLQLEPQNAENYILLSSMYALTSDWEKMGHMRKQMKDLGVKSVPGCSSIEIDGFLHEFVMGDWSHPEAKEIREVLKDVSERVQWAGHKPWISNVLHSVDDEEKANALFEHSERLAIAFGLLKTKAPTVIRVVKNLRVCGDCHEVTKIISRLYEREIIVRDRVRFHRFINGVCSCGDFW